LNRRGNQQQRKTFTPRIQQSVIFPPGQREQGAGSREQGVGSWEQGVGRREKRVGSWEKGEERQYLNALRAKVEDC